MLCFLTVPCCAYGFSIHRACASSLPFSMKVYPQSPTLFHLPWTTCCSPSLAGRPSQRHSFPSSWSLSNPSSPPPPPLYHLISLEEQRGAILPICRSGSGSFDAALFPKCVCIFPGAECVSFRVSSSSSGKLTSVPSIHPTPLANPDK